MKKIIVTINFSEQSPVIIKYAFKFAQYFSADLDFVYVLSKGDDMKMDDAEEKLSQYINSYYAKQYHSIIVNTYVGEGNVSKVISNFAKQLKSDLLLVGKHYQNKFSLFGDATDSLISNCPCPVMAIPADTPFHSFKRIIYSSTFLLEDCMAIFELQQWLKVFKGELICINVSKNEEGLKVASRKMTILERLFPQPNISFRCMVSDEDMAIERYANLNEGDVLCTMHKDRTMFQSLYSPSMSKELARHSNIPLIVFHQHMLYLGE